MSHHFTHSILGGSLLMLGLGVAHANSPGADHGVFIMSNDADRNEIIAYARTPDGRLEDPQTYATNGRGSGGTVDPLASQGALTLSDDGNWLFAANAGSGTVTAFAVNGSRLHLTDKVPSGGAEPNSIAQHGHLVYVLNTAGASSVVGFWFEAGRFVKIPDSLRYLSGTAVGSGSVAFSADGRWLAVTEKATQAIDIFSVKSDGTLSTVSVNKNVGPGTFSAVFAPNGTLLAAETGAAGATNGSAISSYKVLSNGTIQVISASIPTEAAATCWDVIANAGKTVYTSNAATSSISGFSISASGALMPLPGTVVGLNPSGSTNLDIASSGDGKYLFTLNTGSGSVGSFAIDPSTGLLTDLGSQGRVPQASGANGIAAN